MNAFLIQPPFTQLNAPYPAIHYLEAFLRDQGHGAAAWDHSIGLYRRIFSSAGLAKVFAGVRERRAALKLDEASRAQLERYLSNERLYIEWIDGIVAFLSGGDPAMAHRLASAVELPIGARAEALLEARDGRIGPDEARALATRILDDLGDLISFALDQDFGTVRYAERLASSRADFGEVLKALDDSWLIREFYEPMLREFWTERARAAAEDPEAEGPSAAAPADLILITIPFPGCLLGALACARAARRAFASTAPRGSAARAFAGAATPAPLIAFGGGYVSTELRDLRDARIFDFCDYLCFDAGYGSLASILERKAGGRERGRAPDSASADAAGAGAPGAPDILYKVMSRGADGAIDASSLAADTSGDAPAWERFRGIERAALASVAPDYRSADFGACLRVVDSENPMHRLWSDTPWLKYYLAHGCYWRRCSFCDTELDYVADFARADVGAVLAAADAAARRTGLHGIHFVDEALPMAALLEFARANRARAAGGDRDAPGAGLVPAAAPYRQRPFSFWGNVRFDASWTQGRCEFLAASGLVAVSAGIEIATARGLAMTDKGFDLAGLVRTLVAMRRAGLLVHAYLIYGFPGQPAADIVDSAEFCRQLFASGLVDSAFWHRFVLTRHSRMHRQWRDGGRPELKPIDRPWTFANNDLSFEGERAFDRFDAPLAASLAAWMEGAELERPASTWFGRGAPRASIAPDYVETLIEKAEAALDGEEPAAGARAHWIAGVPLVDETARGLARLSWACRGEMVSLNLPRDVAVRAAEILTAPELGYRGSPYAELAARLALPPEAMAELRASGLALT
jgi:hypothetical protein